MLLDISAEALLLLTLGHIVAIALSLGATLKEYKGKHRSTLMGAYLYVAFISVLSIVTYAPALAEWSMPKDLLTTVEMVRNVAILFFVIGLGDLLRKKSAPPNP